MNQASKDNEYNTKRLSIVLADTYTLYMNTQKAHWNVEGPSFYGLHILLDKQYHELAEMVDVLAERLRTLGEFAPGSYDEFASLTTLPQTTKMMSKESDLVRALITSYEGFISHILDAIDSLRRDPGTVDILTQQLEVHQKSLWMLKAHRL